MSDEVDSKIRGNSQERGTGNLEPGKRVRVLVGHILSGCEATILGVRDEVVYTEVDLTSNVELELPSYLVDKPDLRLYYRFHISEIEVL
ncbi:hypothetical protein NZD89_18135 [Alicyclobacillus fastidiosus]|uniref:DUF2187 domain-containing protein n=1 Tax=Alicyclobacillus fastidiosus TaxID=392011 RepID=A0ABY6ZBL6_9BACL|nr:hypothetical protein [Alicyclobacillus fastidiosus]WAH40279.1 hypothetical protein NZD89_18135 [Alicyclobacillus fastidiosus]GMA61656.1 hypothetical protein GCM10025859_20960 [Alicyclobacillus fastidiosus]